MRLAQLRDRTGHRRVAATDGNVTRLLAATRSVYELALEAIETETPLARLVEMRGGETLLDLDEALRERRVLPPLDHPDPAHCLISGTGLTHLGSADARDRMHRTLAEAAESSLSDSMKMFRLGIEGGKPDGGGIGVQPEWFYKGAGEAVVAPESPFPLPEFGLDAGEETEIVGLYIVDPRGAPWRIGFALGNELSDHVMERQNYLYLAHSKLRACSFGPEVLLGDLPPDVRGRTRILRGDATIWERAFLSGEANMSHSIRNLEHHHFKHAQFRRGGDVHVHFFGAATLSFSEGVRLQRGDLFEIEAEPFGKPLRNALGETVPTPAEPVRAL